VRITRIEDPRDNLEKADRDQLYRFAVRMGVKEIDDRMYMGGNAASLMRMILRQRGYTNIGVPQHQLGMPRGTSIEQPSGNPPQMLDDMLKEQLKTALEKPAPKAVEVKELTMWELRKECKARGIKMQRTDNLKTLREKLNGLQAAS